MRQNNKLTGANRLRTGTRFLKKRTYGKDKQNLFIKLYLLFDFGVLLFDIYMILYLCNKNQEVYSNGKIYSAQRPLPRQRFS